MGDKKSQNIIIFISLCLQSMKEHQLFFLDYIGQSLFVLFHSSDCLSVSWTWTNKDIIKCWHKSILMSFLLLQYSCTPRGGIKIYEGETSQEC